MELRAVFVEDGALVEGSNLLEPYALMLCQAWSSVIMLREQHSCLSVPLLRREQHHRWPLCQLLQHGLSTDMLTAPPFHLNSGVVFGAAGLA